jgi:hypothetical protein
MFLLVICCVICCVWPSRLTLCGCSPSSVTIPDLPFSRALDFNESLNIRMIQPDVDTKSAMPDGSAVLPDTVPHDPLIPAINGDQPSPIDLPPESPEDKGIIRCTAPPSPEPRSF